MKTRRNRAIAWSMMNKKMSLQTVLSDRYVWSRMSFLLNDEVVDYHFRNKSRIK